MKKKNIMKNYLLNLSLLILLSGNLSAQFITVEEDKFIEISEGKLLGTLKVPPNTTKVPLAILIAGSGSTDRNGNQPGLQCNSSKMLCQELYNNGIASLAYDKRFSGKSVINQKEEDVSFDDYVNDVCIWVDSMSKDKRFSEIILIGHSEGATLAILAANKCPKINKIVSLAGPGKPMQTILKEQLSIQLAMQPQSIKDEAFGYIDRLEAGEKISNIPPHWNMLFRPSVQPFLISCFKYNPQTEIAKLKIPILIIQGSTDIQVREENGTLLQKANPKAKLLMIENMNHVLKNCTTTNQVEQLKTYKDGELQIHKELSPAICKFIRNTN